jgi:hypothetical protein
MFEKKGSRRHHHHHHHAHEGLGVFPVPETGEGAGENPAP